MASHLRATDIPRTRVDALHVMRLNGDDPDELSDAQYQACRKLYFLDDPRSVKDRVLAGVL